MKEKSKNPRVWISLRSKFIILFIILLSLTIGANIHYATSLFKSDKTAYIYETGLNKSQLLASRLKEIIHRVVDNTITLGNVMNSTRAKRIKIELGKGSLGVLTTETLDNKTIINKKIINRKLLKKLLVRYKMKRAKLLDSTLSIIDANIDHKKKINIISLLQDMGLPVIVIAIKKGPFKQYINLFNIEPLISDLEADSAYENTLVNYEGKEIFSKQTRNQSYVKMIIDSKVDHGSKKIMTQDKMEKLVSYTKIPSLGLIFITALNTSDAFKVIEELKTKSVYFGLFILGFAITLVVLLSLTITTPIKRLVQGINKMGEGDFSARVKVKSLDETRRLAATFNFMAERITELIEEMVKKARLEKEVETAKVIQEALFPEISSNISGVQVNGFYQSASECNGDWWFYEQIGTKLYFFIADATGHGVPAALMTASVRATLATLKNRNEYLSPAAIMQYMNNSVCSTSRGQLFMTFFIGCYDVNLKTFIYSNASHNTPFKISKTTNDIQITDMQALDEARNPRLGQEVNYDFSEVITAIRPGDKILFYTDGVTETENANGRQLGEKKFLNIVASSLNESSSPQETIGKMKAKIDDHRGTKEFDDDITYFITQF